MPYHMPQMSGWAACFALQAFVSVAAGAFGAHALTGVFDESALSWWRTGSQYLMYHALAGLIVAAFLSPAFKPILILFLIGNAVFAGSLYVMALTGYRFLGALTPIGGVCYLSAWLLLAFRLWRSNRVES